MPGESSRLNGKKGGRPEGALASHTLLSQQIRQRLVERFNADADELYDAQVQAAKGLFVAITDPSTGEVIKIAKKAPSTEAYKILLNQSIGMAKQHVDHTTKDEKITGISDSEFNKLMTTYAQRGTKDSGVEGEDISE